MIVYLDFAKTRGKKCGNDDYEKWFARPHDSECLMGHKVRIHSVVFFEVG